MPVLKCPLSPALANADTESSIAQESATVNNFFIAAILQKSVNLSCDIGLRSRTHKRLIDITNSTPKTVEALMGLELPAGVEIEIKL